MDQIIPEPGQKLLELEPKLEPKNVDAYSWSLKFEFQHYSSVCSQALTYFNGICNLLPGFPTTSPRVQKAWPKKSCKTRTINV